MIVLLPPGHHHVNVAHLFIYFDDEDDFVVAINSNFFSFFSPPFVHLDVRVPVQSARVRCRTRPPARAVLNPSSTPPPSSLSFFQRAGVVLLGGQRLRRVAAAGGPGHSRRAGDPCDGGPGPGEGAVPGRRADVQGVRPQQIHVSCV